MNKIILSIDTNCLNNQNWNLNIKNIESLKNFKVFTDAYEFRNYINTNSNANEFWILSSDNIEAINLAATCKKDRPKCKISLVTKDFSIDFKQRAKAAKIDKLLSTEEFNQKVSEIEKSICENKSRKNINKLYKTNLEHFKKITSDNNTTKKSLLLSVISSTGGSGKSSVSIMSAIIAQTIGYKTLLLDADLQFGETAYILGINNPLKIDDLITDSNNIVKLNPSNNIPAVLAPPVLPELSEKVIEYLPYIIKLLKQKFEIIIVNTSTFWNEIQALLIENGSKSLFLVDQTPNSIHTSKIAIDLCDRCGIPLNSVTFCLNKCSKKSLFTTMDISYAINGIQVLEIADGNIEVPEYMAASKPYKLLENNNPFAISLSKILFHILPISKKNLENFNFSHEYKKRSTKKLSSFLQRK